MNARIKFSLIILGAAIALSGCGRKAALDTPYQASVDAHKEAVKNGEPMSPEPKKPVQERKFFLDSLI